ncbi:MULTISPECIES: DsbA family protein [Edwardsiella]|uniref:Thiol:disulfide interchange protein n=2 Tax=Edwardsiella anguillarum TaxID=1821960 RepID=A0A076LND6_9GAMM|nr:Periplasmic thiol:disulfide interchange protein DsbA [Edwardsiella anguillarum ET080813]KAB0590465.1 thioredoxin domain-containing protein [Edwardsiella anguillarum]RFS99543.1 protein disulfide oxidoreductase DsbA [Edwardsiella anguillarum]BET80282.1 Protein thiol-disulfide isomerase DsbC [Edwardsiella anguillarum]BET83571.1 Protein thiol-disulfide isomerase DsbC [Edwardsiella anguillarum]
MMKTRLFQAAAGLLVLCSVAAQAAGYQEGKQYTDMPKAVPGAPAVVEFFSFYCPPCNQFANVYRIGEAVNGILPPGEKVVKYHVSFLGPQGAALTEAWSVAQALGVSDKVEKPLFDAVQVKRSINSPADIRQVFVDSGVAAAEYDAALNSFVVKSLTARQENAVQAFGVRGTPSFYVAGKYQIKNDGMQATSIDGYRSEYADVVKFLLAQGK